MLSISKSSSSLTDECFSSTSGALDPSSFNYYDAIYDHVEENDFASSSRIKSVEVVPPIDDEGSSIKTSRTYALMRFVSIYSFSFAAVSEEGGHALVARGAQPYSDASGLMMGMYHFNNGIGDVVREATGIDKTCPIRFVLDDFYDSESSQVTAVDHFGRLIIDRPDRPPSGLFGSWRSAVSVPLAILSGAYALPQISPLSTSTELDDTTVYRYFSRLIPSDAGTARAAVDYFRQPEINLKHLGVLYVNDAYGSAFHQAIVEAAVSRPEGDRISVKGFPFSYNSAVAQSVRDLELQIEQLALTGFRYFFGVFYDEHYELIMEAAHKFGIAGPGYVWIISDGLSETFLDGRVYKSGSALAIASQGIGILKAEGGRETVGGNSGFDRFAKVWHEQGEESVNYYNCKQPKMNSVNDTSIYFKGEPNFFTSRKLLSGGAVFAYDSAIAMGLAACELYENNGDAYFDGEELFDAFISQSFEGASGVVSIDPKTRSRDPKSAFFVMYNANGRTEAGNTTFGVKTVVHTTPNPNLGSSSVLWVGVDHEEFVYSDGTATPPDPLPVYEKDLNQVPSGIRGAGLALSALVLLGSLIFSGWTLRNHQNRVVRASQPEFLHMICAGTLLLGSTIIPLSFDDSIASVRGCDIACMSSPWLFAYGFTTVFSALFSKTWRINKIMHNARFKRMKVTASDVIKPFVVLLTLNTIILSFWTIMEPLEWQRITTESTDKFERPNESYGMCTSDDKGYLPYAVPLLLTNLSVIVLANYQAYRARNIATEFSESKYIAIIVVSIFQALVIGLPLFILAAEDPSARFIVSTGIIVMICVSTLCFMFIPKMIHLKEEKMKTLARQRLKEERNLTRAALTATAQNNASESSSSFAPAAVHDTDISRVHVDVKTSRRTHRQEVVSPGMMGTSDNDSDYITEGMPTMPRIGEARDVTSIVHALHIDLKAKEGLQRANQNDNKASQHEIDEELAVTNVVAPTQNPLNQPIGCRRRAAIACADHTSSASSDSSEDDVNEGLEIISCVHAEENKSLRLRLRTSNLDKLDLAAKVRSLKELLARNGINEDPKYSMVSATLARARQMGERTQSTRSGMAPPRHRRSGAKSRSRRSDPKPRVSSVLP